MKDSMIITYEKKPVGYYAYLVLSKRLKDRLGKALKDVHIYPIYDGKMDIIGIQVTETITKETKWIDRVITGTLLLKSKAA